MPVVVSKHAAESFAAFDLAVGLANVPLGIDQLVVQALMIPLCVIQPTTQHRAVQKPGRPMLGPGNRCESATQRRGTCRMALRW